MVLLFMVIRSFDINRPDGDGSKGCVLGGTLLYGLLRDDKIEILLESIRTRVSSMMTEMNSLTKVYSGGLIGIGTPC